MYFFTVFTEMEYSIFSEAEHRHGAVTGGRGQLEQVWMEPEAGHTGLEPRVRMSNNSQVTIINIGLNHNHLMKLTTLPSTVL